VKIKYTTASLLTVAMLNWPVLGMANGREPKVQNELTNRAVEFVTSLARELAWLHRRSQP